MRREAGISFVRAPRACSPTWADGPHLVHRKGVTRQHTLGTQCQYRAGFGGSVGVLVLVRCGSHSIDATG